MDRASASDAVCAGSTPVRRTIGKAFASAEAFLLSFNHRDKNFSRKFNILLIFLKIPGAIFIKRELTMC